MCHAEDDRSDCSNRRKIHVQSGDKKMGRVLQNWLLFSFGWKAAVLLSMRVCQWRLPTFNLVLSPKEMVFSINYVVRNGTDTFYIFCLPNERWCGTSVPKDLVPGVTSGWPWATLCAIGMG